MNPTYKILKERWHVQKVHAVWFYLHRVSKHAKESCLEVQPLLVGVILGGSEDIDWKGQMGTSGVLVIYPLRPML